MSDPDAVQTFGGGVSALGVLVNCAGIGRRDEEFETATFRRVLETNLFGMMYLANAFKKALGAARDSGRSLCAVGRIRSSRSFTASRSRLSALR